MNDAANLGIRSVACDAYTALGKRLTAKVS